MVGGSREGHLNQHRAKAPKPVRIHIRVKLHQISRQKSLAAEQEIICRDENHSVTD